MKRNFVTSYGVSIYKKLPIVLRRLLFFGRDRYCPVCQSKVRRFLSAGGPSALRSNARCPVCGALERQRLVWLFFSKYTNLFDLSKKSMLHIAPEWSIKMRLIDMPKLNYVMADLYKPATVKMDIMNIPHRKSSFDIIYCSHVLEHVYDDLEALGEFHRVLKPNGWVVVQVPITVLETFEDLSITDPQEREKVFGQHDHVRRYGLDFKERLVKSEFDVQVFSASDVASKDTWFQLGLLKNDKLFFCKKH